jgi:hypothetical protein
MLELGAVPRQERKAVRLQPSTLRSLFCLSEADHLSQLLNTQF